MNVGSVAAVRAPLTVAGQRPGGGAGFGDVLDALTTRAGGAAGSKSAASAPPPATEGMTAKLKAAMDAFRDQASMTPAQRLAKRLRADVLQAMKLSESDIKAMPAAERAVVEQKVGDEVARRMAMLGFGGDRGAGDTGGARAVPATVTS